MFKLFRCPLFQHNCTGYCAPLQGDHSNRTSVPLGILRYWICSDIFRQCNCNSVAVIEIDGTYLRVGEWGALALHKKIRA